MKRTDIMLLITVLAFFLFLSGCSSHKSPAAITELTDPQSPGALNYTPYPPATANNYFGLDLYRRGHKGDLPCGKKREYPSTGVKNHAAIKAAATSADL